MSDDVIAYRLWVAMSRQGWVWLPLLLPDELRVASEMVRRGLVRVHRGDLVQDPSAQLHQWEGLA